ncbi:type II toxin-antitoxin system HipA family toxin [Cellvibrio sp. PSBB006]|jgi:serine/threonine-protein kinase HipA|uniref:type II toxin-antitoxin system HipA family toxin n=1 Tax=Cellvibrio sp. PSBB006 TaxID=1987723 RepID=UPI000B3B7B29|nr:type II toxin-antitoxin system HipA family toxin [Cellvibrio sp. PSBB006]ARU27283.1 toxin HipA [Cellvibrio sp. PSBB006]
MSVNKVVEKRHSKVDVADVFIWGTRVGAVAWDDERELGFFEYDPTFLRAPAELAPLMMPRARTIYSFPELDRQSYKGLPGMLADALPDKFGNLLIDRWLEQQGRDRASFSPVERLCYMGERGMGALEFRPAIKRVQASQPLEIAELAALANRVLSAKSHLQEQLTDDLSDQRSALGHILAVGTSAGGARAKAVIAWNPETGEVRSGQISAGQGFEHWLLKFDGIAENADKELNDPQGFGRIEYAYYLMATAADIEMSESRLLEEGGRAHFMTRRFDRRADGDKLHMQSLCAIAHYDFNIAGGYSYEQALQVIKRLNMDSEKEALEQQYRRMVFNVIARNQDDHTKNIAFLMDRQGNWQLAPAFDVIYSYNPRGEWTSRHQMTVNEKRDDFMLDDLLAVAVHGNIKTIRAKKIITQVVDAVSEWKTFATRAGVFAEWREEIARHHRLVW